MKLVDNMMCFLLTSTYYDTKQSQINVLILTVEVGVVIRCLAANKSYHFQTQPGFFVMNCTTLKTEHCSLSNVLIATMTATCLRLSSTTSKRLWRTRELSIDYCPVNFFYWKCNKDLFTTHCVKSAI